VCQPNGSNVCVFVDGSPVESWVDATTPVAMSGRMTCIARAEIETSGCASPRTKPEACTQTVATGMKKLAGLRLPKTPSYRAAYRGQNSGYATKAMLCRRSSPGMPAGCVTGATPRASRISAAPDTADTDREVPLTMGVPAAAARMAAAVLTRLSHFSTGDQAPRPDQGQDHRRACAPAGQERDGHLGLAGMGHCVRIGIMSDLGGCRGVSGWCVWSGATSVVRW